MSEFSKPVHVVRREEARASEGSSAPATGGSTVHRNERVVDVLGTTLLSMFVIGWIWTIATAGGPGSNRASATSHIAAALTSPDAPTVAYLTDASLNALTDAVRGTSGKLRADIRIAGTPIASDTSADGAVLTVAENASSGSTVAPKTGIWKLAVAVGKAIKPVTDLNLISVRPRAEKQNGRIGLYYLGSWPGEANGIVRAPSKAPSERYQPPSGFIEVTRENADTKLSEHFKLRDFLTHDQQNVWPKYLVITLRNIDKLELVLADLEAQGIKANGVRVLSGFRTPQYNKGGGTTSGRAELSRHMYGDAADIFIDNDGNGNMDDLNHDGRVDIRDSRVVLEAVDRVEKAHPEFVGGAGVYPAASGHGPFIHIDSRGYHARWIGSGGG